MKPHKQSLVLIHLPCAICSHTKMSSNVFSTNKAALAALCGAFARTRASKRQRARRSHGCIACALAWLLAGCGAFFRCSCWLGGPWAVEPHAVVLYLAAARNKQVWRQAARRKSILNQPVVVTMRIARAASDGCTAQPPTRMAAASYDGRLLEHAARWLILFS